MKITSLETIRVAERPNLLWVQVHTDEGLAGLGETFFGAATVEAHVHEHIAPRVIGGPAGDRPLAGDLVAIWAFGLGAEVGATRPSTSRSGTFSARQPVSRSPNFWAASPAGRFAPTTPAPGRNTSRRRTGRHGQYDGWRPQGYDDLNGFCIAPTNWPVAAGRRHHRDEDLALRHRGGSVARPIYLDARSEEGTGAVREDPPRDRRQDGHHGRVPL